MNQHIKGVFRWCNEALAALDRTIEMKPNVATAYYKKGSLLFDLGKFEEAVVALERAVDLGLPDNQVTKKISMAYWNLYWCDYQDRSECG